MFIKIKHYSIYGNKIFRRLRQKFECLSPIVAFSSNPPQIEQNHLSEWSSIATPIENNIVKYLSTKDCKTIVSNANSICKNEFHLLGGNLSCPNENIDWHTDFINNLTWPSNILYSKVRSHTIKGADIKVPWELSRFNFAISLNFAYLVNGDRKYLDKFIYLSTNWINSNPVGYGVNWACTMDVAIRAVNWTIALALFNEPLSTGVYYKFRKKISDSLWVHANFIKNHLEWNGPRANSGANHLLFNFVGLYTLGVFFKNSIRGKKWLEYAQSNLEIQMDRQVLDDGVHFERSIGYHRLCLEAFLWCKGLAQRNEQPFSSKYNSKLQKMQKFVSSYVRFSSIAPLIGDNDDGRLIDSSLLPLSDHRYLLPESNKGEFYIDRFLLDGSTSVGHHNTSSKSSSFEDSGFFFFYNSYASLIVRAGILAFDGTHAHNDQLSFSLSIKGQDVFVDRGTCQYSADANARNFYRSTETHNVLQVNDQEQNPLGSIIFSMPDHTKSKVLNLTKDSIEVVHHGFQILNRLGAEYHRRLSIFTTELIIIDFLNIVKYNDILKWHFHLAPGLTTNIDSSKVNIMRDSNLLCTLMTSQDMEISVLEFSHSPSYGVIQQAKIIQIQYIVLRKEIAEPFKFTISWDLK